mmetsp:Transcript_145537/g.362896  ORF Transcript_145537/g.362896 Transcript_145537/m.362896 type:complete len:496 (-) Transcript_145537:201-1688(-)
MTSKQTQQLRERKANKAVAPNQAVPPKGPEQQPRTSVRALPFVLGAVVVGIVYIVGWVWQRGASREILDSHVCAPLLRHLLSVGGSLHASVEVRDVDGYRSLAVTKSVTAGEVLFWIPYEVVMHSGLHPKVQQLVSTEAPAAPESLAATLLVEQRRGQASPFAAYIASLPAKPMSIVNFPMEIQAVLAKLYFSGVEEHLAFSLSKVQNLSAEAMSPPATEEEARWALGIVASRATSVLAPRYPLALIPIFDMLNHGGGSEPRVSCGSEGWRREGFACRSPELQTRGEVFTDYGENPSLFYLGNYGFLPKQRLWLRRKVALQGNISNISIPEAYNCTEGVAILFPQRPTKESLWSALRCWRLGHLRLHRAGIQEFASANGWFDMPLSALPQDKSPVGDISGDRVWYLATIESKILGQLSIRLLEDWYGLLNTDDIAPLVKEMTSKRPTWEPRLQKLAEELEREVAADAEAIRKTFEVVSAMQDDLAWTDNHTGSVS